jgi:hypothetical protein
MSMLDRIRESLANAGAVGICLGSVLRLCLRACCRRPQGSDASELDRLMLASSDGAFSKCGVFNEEMADQDPFSEAGNPCTICSSETRYNTHFGFPCHHAACEQCWQTWRHEHSTCMICGDNIKSVHGFSDALIKTVSCRAQVEGMDDTAHIGASPVQGNSAHNGMHSLNSQLESALAQLIHELVLVKARLREVCTPVPTVAIAFRLAHARLNSPTQLPASTLRPPLSFAPRTIFPSTGPPGSPPPTRSCRFQPLPTTHLAPPRPSPPPRRRCTRGWRRCGRTWTAPACAAWAPTRAPPSPPSRPPPSRTRSAGPGRASHRPWTLRAVGPRQ